LLPDTSYTDISVKSVELETEKSTASATKNETIGDV